MAGSRLGGLRAAATNKERHGEHFYAAIAREAQKSWAANGRAPRGFSVNRVLASEAGRIGGRRSSREGVPNGYGKRAIRSRMAAEAAQA